jgi:hypothetical protein
LCNKALYIHKHELLGRIERLGSWAELVTVIALCNPEGSIDWPPFPLVTM